MAHWNLVWRSRRFVCFGCTVAVLLGGCGRDNGTAPVSGKVTVDGKPLAFGEIFFMPTSGRMAHATIQPDGSYQLTTYETGDGALIGDHTVTIEALRVESNAPEPKTLEEEVSMEGGLPPQLVMKETRLVSEKYGDAATTPLRATVEDKKLNEINFDL